MLDPLDRLAQAIEEVGTGELLVITGAGVSTASGLSTFRGPDPDAIWARDVMEIATFGHFQRDPVGFWRWFIDRFGDLPNAEPNAAHRALAALERWQVQRGGRILLVTQNIDTLHERAGSRNLVKVHGTSDRLRCAQWGCRFGAPKGSIPVSEVEIDRFVDDPRIENLPRCPECGTLLRAHALLFDEFYGEHVEYGFPRVEEALERFDLLLFAGTSFSVGVTELALQAAWMRGVPAYSIDPTAAPPRGVVGIREPAEHALPELVGRLGAEVGASPRNGTQNVER